MRVFARDVAAEFRDACRYLRVGVKVEAASAPTFRTPRVGRVVDSSPLVVTVEMLPGQVPSDLEEPARRLAGALGLPGVRIERISGRWVRLVLPDPDPPPGPVGRRHGPRRVPRCAGSRIPVSHSTG